MADVERDCQLQRLRKIGKELVRELLDRTIDETLAELRQLSTNLGVDLIGQRRAAVLFSQVNIRAALGKKPVTPPSPSPEIL